MRKVFTILIALMLSFMWASAQTYSNVGKILYSQLDSVVNDVTGYSSWLSGSAGLGGTYNSADDFTVPSGGWAMHGFTFYSNKSSLAINGIVNINLTIYNNSGGIPGAIYASTAMSSYDVVQIGYNIYQYNLKIPTVDLSNFVLTPGTYWVSVVPQGTYISNQWLTSKRSVDIGFPGKQKDVAAMPAPYVNWSTKADVGNDNSLSQTVPGTVFYHNLEFAILGAPESNDLSVKKIISPEHGELTAASDVKIAIENNGLNTQTSFQAMYQVSATVNNVFTEIGTATENITGVSYAANSINEYTFTQKIDLSALNTYSVSAKVILAGDTNPYNNRLTRNAKNYGELYVMGTDRFVTACNGIFTDDQGELESPYTIASYDTITFYPGTPGNRVSLDFTMRDVPNNDPLTWTFYDGPTSSSPILYQYTRTLVNWWTGPIKARNPQGIVTVLLKNNQVGTGKGWEANVSCFTPVNIDFMALGLSVGYNTKYNVVGQPVDVAFAYTNAGSDTTTRTFYLMENGVVVDNVTSRKIVPGVQDTLRFTWRPTNISETLKFKVAIQDDPQATNTDNFLEKTVAVYPAGKLLESFESTTSTAPPLEWISRLNTAITTTSQPKHGLRSITIAGVDTLIMPLMNPVVGDSLVFYCYPTGGATKLPYVIASKSLTGPWTTVGTVTWIGYAMNQYKFDLSTYTDGPYYFAIAAATNTGTSTSYIDHVRGGTLYHYSNDLLANGLTTSDTYIKTGREFVFNVAVNNVGTQNILGSDYSVNIRSASMVYATVNGVAINSNGSAVIEIPCTFTTPANLALYGEIVLTGETRTDNNNTRATNFTVLDDYTYSLPVNTSNVTLMSINRKNSISETIYYPKEVGLYGSLKGVEYMYTNTGATAVPAVPIKIYVGNTRFVTDSVFGTYVAPNGYPWIETDSVPAGMTLVYDGTVDFAATVTNKTLYIPFTTPYSYDGIKNLVVMLVKGTHTSAVTTISFKNAIKKDTGFGTRMLYGYNVVNPIDPTNPICSNSAGTIIPSANSGVSAIPKTRFYFDNAGAPIFESTPVTTVNELTSYLYTAEIKYTSPKAYTMTATGMPSWMSINKLTDTTYALSGTASTLGTYPIKLVATDNSFSATQRYSLEVYAVPDFTSTPVTSAVINNLYNYTATATYHGSGFAQIIGDASNPSWITVTDNGDNTATISGTPTTTGDYTITLHANGAHGTTDVQVYTLKVLVGPLFVGLSDKFINEGEAYSENLTVQYYGTGTVTVTPGANFPSWLSLNRDINFTMTGTAVMGVYPIELITTDGTRRDTGRYTITVYDTPEFTSIPDTLALSFQVYNYTATVSNLGAGATAITGGVGNPTWLTITDNGNKTATISGTPEVLGDYTIKLIATGDGGATDEQVYTLTVGVAPIFSLTNDQHVTENVAFTQNVSAVYGGLRTLSIIKGANFPTWITLTDNGDKTAALTGATNVLGIHNIQLIATDGFFGDTLDYLITVYAVPEFASNPVTAVLKDSVYTYNVVVTNRGIGATTITGGTGNPSWITVTDKGDNTATLSGTGTAIGDYTITLIATGAKGATSQQVYTLRVDVLPVLETMANVFMNEGLPYIDTVMATYGGIGTLTISAGANFPTWLTVTDKGNKTATITGTSVMGVHNVELVANTGKYTSTTQYAITVYDTPEFTSVPLTRSVFGQVYTYLAQVANNGVGTTTITGGAGNPAWLTVTDNGDKTATVTGTPNVEGNYTITLITTGQGGATTTQTYTLLVAVGPAFTQVTNQSVNVGTAFNQTVTIQYAGSGTPTITSVNTLPTWLTLTYNNNLTATLTGTPVIGTYPIVLGTTDGTNFDTARYTITVYAIPEIVSAPATLQTLVNKVYSYTAVVTNVGPGLTHITGGTSNPSWITLTDNGNNTATLTGTPTAVGNYSIKVIATGDGGATDEQVFVVTVGVEPVFDVITNSVVNEGDAYTKTIGVTYIGLNTLTISKGANFPTWLTLTDNGNKTATLTGTAVAGDYIVNVIASDGTYSDSTSYQITVYSAPIFVSTPVEHVLVNEVYTYDVLVTNPEIGAIQISGDSSNPTWISVTDNGDNSATVTGTPSIIGDYAVTLVATSVQGATSKQVYTVSVGIKPEFDAMENDSINEGVEYAGAVSVTYEGLNELTISEGNNFPTWLTLTDNGDKTATLSGTAMVGEYTVELIATDGTYSDTLSYQIVVNNLPVFVSSPMTYHIVGEVYTYIAAVTYAGTGFATISGGSVNPSWLTVNNNGDNTATVSGTPTVNGNFTVTLIATGVAGATVEQIFELIVGVGPTFNAIDDQLVQEGEIYTSTATVIYDGIGTAVITAGANFPEWLTLTDNGDNTATISGTAVVGDYPIELLVNDGFFSDAITYQLTVGAVPVFTSTPVVTCEQDVEYVYNVTVDYNGTDALMIVSEDLPTWLTLTDNGDGTAKISGTTSATGYYNVSITANGQYYSSTQTYELEVIVGVNDLNSASVKVYPNPASKWITMTNAKDAIVEIFDITGQVVKIQTMTSVEEKIDVSMFNQGVYTVVITNLAGKISKRLIIE